MDLSQFSYFQCSRQFIEDISRLTQKNVLIELYCGDSYEHVNLVSFYYNTLEESKLHTIVLFGILIPILFLLVGEIADSYLSVSLKNFGNTLKLSPAIASVTVIAYSSGVPELLTAKTSAS